MEVGRRFLFWKFDSFVSTDDSPVSKERIKSYNVSFGSDSLSKFLFRVESDGFDRLLRDDCVLALK